MHFCCDAPRRAPDYFADFHCLETLEVQQDDLPVHWFQRLDQHQQSLHRDAPVGNILDVALFREIIDLIKACEGRRMCPSSNGVRGRRIVCNAIHPGPQ